MAIGDVSGNSLCHLLQIQGSQSISNRINNKTSTEITALPKEEGVDEGAFEMMGRVTQIINNSRSSNNIHNSIIILIDDGFAKWPCPLLVAMEEVRHL